MQDLGIPRYSCHSLTLQRLTDTRLAILPTPYPPLDFETIGPTHRLMKVDFTTKI